MEHPDETKAKMRGHKSWLGRYHTEASKCKMRLAKLGKKASKDTKLKLSISHKGLIAKERNPNWNGGVTGLRESIRDLPEYRWWRDSIFSRDSYTCKKCGRVGGVLNAHHEVSFCDILMIFNITSVEAARQCNLLWDINNGTTLCKKGCHTKR